MSAYSSLCVLLLEGAQFTCFTGTKVLCFLVQKWPHTPLYARSLAPLLLHMRALLPPQVLVESGGFLWERELGPPAMPLFRKQAWRDLGRPIRAAVEGTQFTCAYWYKSTNTDTPYSLWC